MEQLSLFEEAEETNVENTSPQESVPDADTEISDENYTKEEKFLICVLKEIVKNSYDPDCTLHIYKSAEGKNKTPRISFKLDQVGQPKWFSLVNANAKMRRLEIIMSETDLEEDPEIREAFSSFVRITEGEKHSRFNQYEYIIRNRNECSIYFDYTEESLAHVIRTLSPLFIKRFDFLYDHRIVEPCCCGRQSECIRARKCVQGYREMAMKCSFRKLKERNSEFFKGSETEG